MTSLLDLPAVFVRKARTAALLLFRRHNASALAALSHNDWATRTDAEQFARYWEDENAEHRLKMAKIIEPLAPSTIYEFGCFAAPTLKLLKQRLPRAEVYGTDINPLPLAYARERMPELHLAVADDRSVEFLETWLPPHVDVSLSSSVFYGMSTQQVERLLRFLATRSSYILIGCNFSNYDGRRTRTANDGNQHPYAAIFKSLNLEVVSRHPLLRRPDHKSLTDFFLVRPSEKT